MKRDKRILKRLLAFGLGLCVAAGGMVGFGKKAGSTMLVEKLQVEYMNNPVGIDTAVPQFSWQLTDTVRGQRQTAYRIMVSSTLERLKEGQYDVWDSGKVVSDQTSAVDYAGPALTASTRYYWQVGAWDKDALYVQSAQEAYWETGLMDSGWDGAQWIGIGNTPIADPEEPDAPCTVFTIEMDYWINQTAFGLIFGAADENNFYMWQINANGADGKVRLRPHKWTNGVPGMVEGGEPDLSAVYPSQEDAADRAHLKIAVDNGRIETYINSVLVDTRTVEAFDVGKLGFRAADESYSVDNVMITADDGTVLLEDDFSSATHTYFAGGTLENGVLKVHSPGMLTLFFQQEATDSPTDFTIDVDFTVINTAFGLIFGAQDEGNFYMWQVNTANKPDVVQFRPHKWTNGSPSGIADVDIDHVFPTVADAVNHQAHMRIEVRSGEIKTYINDVLIDTLHVDSFGLGKIGFRAAAEEFLADNVVIRDAAGQVIFEDHFDNPGNPQFAGGTVVNGQLQVTTGPFFQREITGIDCSSFNLDIDFKIQSGAFEVAFGAQDEDTYYLWQVNADGEEHKVRLRPHQWLNGIPSTIGTMTDLSAWYPTSGDILDKWLHLRLEVRDGEVKTYIGNTLVDVRYLPIFDLGRIGFRAAGTSYWADNLKVTAPDGAILFADDFDDDRKLNFLGGSVDGGVIYFDRGVYFQKSGDSRAAPMLRREFEIPDKKIESARLYATAAGVYEMTINGKQVGDSYLNPGSTQYDEHILYQTFDVTSLLEPGVNAIGGMLGHGWYNGGLRVFGTELALFAKLLIRYADGTADVLVTDGTWSYTDRGPIVADDIFYGEQYDATREIEGWMQVGYDDSGWYYAGVKSKEKLQIGDITAQSFPLIRQNKTLHPLSVTEPQPGVYVYDFGQNFSGFARITAQGSAGDEMVVRHAEILNDSAMVNGDDVPGTIYTGNLSTARNTDVYTFKGDPAGETYEPHFVYRGFRYLEISGVTHAPALEEVTGIAFWTDLDETSSFDSSNELLNQLYSNVLWSQRDNFMSIPTDCPQRNERWGWTGDVQIFGRTAAYNMNVVPFFRKYMMDMRDTQHFNGAFNDVAPSAQAGSNSIDNVGVNGWGDAAVIVPWQVYQQYGDKTIIRENYDAMCTWMDYLVATSDNYIRAKGWCGDWLPVGEETPFGVTDTAYCAYSAKLLSKMAAVIGKTEDAAKYEELYRKYRAAWNRAFVNPDGSTSCGTQTSYALGLQFDLFEDRAAAAQQLADNINRHDGHLTTGFLGGSYLTPVLTDTGYTDVAYRLLEQTDAPSWLYSVTTGSTTIWESWEAYKINPDGTSVVNGKSYNHYAYGAVFEWIFKDVVGIERDEDHPGFKHILLQPTPGGNLTHAGGTYESVHGRIASSWTLENGVMTYEATVPANTTATVYLPVPEKGMTILEGVTDAADAPGVTFKEIKDGKAIYEVMSGSYRFTVNPASGGGEESGDVPATGETAAAVGTCALTAVSACLLYTVRRRKRRSA